VSSTLHLERVLFARLSLNVEGLVVEGDHLVLGQRSNGARRGSERYPFASERSTYCKMPPCL
jgi:hypothetical protein